MGQYDNRYRGPKKPSNSNMPSKRFKPSEPRPQRKEPDRPPMHMPQSEAEVAFTRIEYMIDDQERHLCRYVIVTTWREVPSVDDNSTPGTGSGESE